MASRSIRTADGNDFRFRAGRPSLDLSSTLLWRYRAPVEQLRTPGDLTRWLDEAGLGPAGPPGTADLERARALREAIHRLVHARMDGERFAAADVAVLNAAARHPAPAPVLTPDGRVRHVSDEPVAAGLSAVARDCVDLLTGPLADRLRECAAPDCAFLFVDTSRPGTRRWCAMNRCGNRQHVRDHRSRRGAP